ncbi:MAG: acetyl-CoA hydrolase/transferase C-terminal domain-containing protein [Moritella sp.]|uniref:acetyl-CoA hydrolase/transferase C-terminal domain-containing protein n=1 Tax=Moritella sp. TaxID=78556 RepID=UPI0029BE7D7D|nr:acetyl-CoA hydrolase/transferase C-terminal domain-containing protein [Moritella sp.]MDX2322368.1 acetyl-CoA hydrolase/transferase C-terminal domain-containing protein [Moritella sp.]
MSVFEVETKTVSAQLVLDSNNTTNKPEAVRLNDVEKLVDAVLAEVGNHIVLGLPIAIGKAITFSNALYQRAKADPNITLQIETAISLEIPRAKTDLENKFLAPFVRRQFADVQELDYMKDIRNNTLPDNITVFEFFFKAGSFLNSSQQLNYTSTNYTHAVRDLIDKGVNVVAQVVAERQVDDVTTYSLCSNSDLALDMLPVLEELKVAEGRKFVCVGEVNSNMPFMRNDAEVSANTFDFILESQEKDYALFAVPEDAISNADHMIGFYASSLIKDGGTLQLGIGSLCSALSYSLLLRHQSNEKYNQVFKDLNIETKFPLVKKVGGRGIFKQGLYGCSELMVDGFMHLYRAGILTRQVFSDLLLQTLLNDKKIATDVGINTLTTLLKHQAISTVLTAENVTYLQKIGVLKANITLYQDTLYSNNESCIADLSQENTLKWIEKHCLGDKLKGGIVMHGAFFIGPKSFYKALNQMTEADHAKFCMTSVNYVNDLYDHFLGDQKIKAMQRKEARFFNSAMMVTLDGSAISDALENGQVVSGVGGQYNFVAQSHQMKDSRSILKLRSTCVRNGKLQSNVLFNYGHNTIPRQLRDVVVTEYGIADLRSKPDHIVYTELIKIADSRFQPQLLLQAKNAGKVAANYEIPVEFCNNTPEAIAAICNKHKQHGVFPKYPQGSSFTDSELKLIKALKSLKNKGQSKTGKFKLMLQGLTATKPTEEILQLLARMDLTNPVKFADRMAQRLLSKELKNK